VSGGRRAPSGSRWTSSLAKRSPEVISLKEAYAAPMQQLQLNKTCVPEAAKGFFILKILDKALLVTPIRHPYSSAKSN
jgi:hypothetical protein